MLMLGRKPLLLKAELGWANTFIGLSPVTGYDKSPAFVLERRCTACGDDADGGVAIIDIWDDSLRAFLFSTNDFSRFRLADSRRSSDARRSH